MLEFPRWKAFFVAAVCLFFLAASAPTILPSRMTEALPSFLPKESVPLGLDLRGGSYLLLEIDFDSYLRQHMMDMRDGLRAELRKAKIGYLQLRADKDAVLIRIRPETVQPGVSVTEIYRRVNSDIGITHNSEGLTELRYSDAALTALKARLLEQSIEIVNRRVNETGTKEPIIQRQGLDRIIVQVPGLQDPSQLKHLLGKTAKMTFHLVNEQVGLTAIENGLPPVGTMLLPPDDAEESQTGLRYPIFREVALSGEYLTNAHATYQDGIPVVDFQFNTMGAQKFGAITQQNIGKRFAVVLDNKVITAPVIRSSILGGRGIIEGNFTVESANELAMLLRAGALPAPLSIIEERSVGPSLGEDSIQSGIQAALLGTGLVVLFMLLSYGLFGLIANLGLIVHLLMILGAMALMQATLTLPGIAGIVLTLGMAVDANVLIFERMRDEIRFGKGPLAAMESGFRLAFGTIFDSNITTLIAAMLLYYFGAGAVKGFAVTLAIGLLSTMFASVMFTRMLLVYWVRSVRPKSLPI